MVDDVDEVAYILKIYKECYMKNVTAWLIMFYLVQSLCTYLNVLLKLCIIKEL